MCPPGYATRGRAADRSYARNELKQKPVPEDDKSGDGQKEDDDESEHAGAGIKNDVGAHDARDSAAGSERRNRRVQVKEDVEEVRADAAEKIKKKIREVAEIVLDVVTKDPEEEHVSGDVQEAHMKEHAGEHGKDGSFKADVAGQEAVYVGGDGGVGQQKGFVLSRSEGQLEEEDDDVRQN